MLNNYRFVQRNPVFSLLRTGAFVVALLLSSGLACAGNGPAAKDDLGRFMAKLEDTAAKIDSFRAVFIQEKELSLFAETIVFHGELVVVRPDRLRWEFTDPVPSILVLNGDKGLRCSDQAAPVNFDLNSDPVMRIVAEQLWLWLGGDYSKLGEAFFLQKKGADSLIITPKNPSMAEYIQTVTITFDQTTMQPARVEILEPGGDLTRLLFSDYTFNIDFPEQLFTRCETQPAHDN
ncbi:MAG: cell envelope biogenesis protein LolA [Desulfotalea sp.]|nr:MAG: cell envelope biogenesis protein LolA [Desulfotalea sp.]